MSHLSLNMNSTTIFFKVACSCPCSLSMAYPWSLVLGKDRGDCRGLTAHESVVFPKDLRCQWAYVFCRSFLRLCYQWLRITLWKVLSEECHLLEIYRDLCRFSMILIYVFSFLLWAKQRELGTNYGAINELQVCLVLYSSCSFQSCDCFKICRIDNIYI